MPSTGIAQTTPPLLVLGRAGAIAAQFTAQGATGSFTVPGYAMSYFGALGTGQMTKFLSTPATPGPPALTITAQRLFPFVALPGPSYAGNYQVWAGRCQGEQPLQPPPGTGAATVTGAPAPAPAWIAEPALDVSVKLDGASITPTDVKITFSGGGCSDTWSSVAAAGTDQVGGVDYAVYPAPFASNAAAGTPTASKTGISGSLSFCADFKVGSSYRQETLTTTNADFSAPTFLPTMDLQTDAQSSSSPTPCPSP